ncbi:MAG TPA: hypothetical protein VMH87_08775, partial [Pseudomonadales bacterium]|nr:hypothetical protein [Pseudomonadales bacterium]
IDYSDKIELLGRRMFGHLWKKRRLPWEDEDFNKDEKELERMEAERRAEEGGEPDDGSQKAEAGKSDNWTDGTDEVEGRPLTPPHVKRGEPLPNGGEGSGVATQASPSLTSEQTQKDTVGPRCGAATADQQVSTTTASTANPYGGRTKQEVIAEIEENYAQQKAERLDRKRQKEGYEEAAATQDARAVRPTMTHIDRGIQKELSAYERALLEGKTHLEAMYAQASPVGKPNAKESLYFKPNPLDGVSEPPRVSGYECRYEPMRPPPGFNSLG